MLVESSGFLLITPKRRILLTDSRYDLAARQEAPLFETVIYQGSLVKTLAETVDLTEGLWFEPRFLTVEKLAELRSVLKIQIQPLPFDPSVLRRVKAPAELALIQKALVITETAVGRLWRALRAGWTEGRAAWFLDQAFRELGAEGSAFETIVASGPQAALPHATPGAKVIQKGEMVVIDCGARYQGYAADITRTRCLGRPTAWQRQIYRVVREAQTRALAALGPDKTGAEVDQVARDWISQAGFGDFFGHGLGHGVGLAVHEGPNLSRLNQEKLPVGAVVTVEPGIYLPGRGGVRLEQMAVVTKGGCQVLNQDVNFYEF
jgi:Xaa-Pro aminopeptidase